MAEPEGVEGVTDQDDDMPILRRRRIEAGIVAPIYRVMERELGTERAREILREAIAAAKAHPRAAQLERIASIRQLGKREALARLTAGQGG